MRQPAAEAAVAPPKCMRILLVEDNRELSDWLAKILRQDRYVVDCVHGGEEADAALQTSSYQLVILDLTLPRMDGREVLRRLRARNDNVAVLILTADNTSVSRVSGLDIGAHDYLAKPFDLDELKARVRALLRRASGGRAPVIRCGDLSYDTNERQFRLRNEPLAFTPREHAVLETLMRGMNRTIGKRALAESVFGFDDNGNPESVEIYIHRVRRKLEGSDARIITLRGLGYLLKDHGAS
jgi:two-component system response regulator TctD